MEVYERGEVNYDGDNDKGKGGGMLTALRCNKK